MLNNYLWWTSVQNLTSISSKMTELERFTCWKQALFTSFLQFSIGNFLFLNFCSILIIQKVYWGHFSCSMRKSDLKTCIATSMTQNFLFDLFDLVTSDDLDRKSLRMVHRSVLDNIHANWLRLRLTLSIFALMPSSTERQFSDFDLTCDVMGDPEVIKIKFLWATFPGLSNAVWISGIGPAVSEIKGGLKIAPPVSGVMKYTQPARGLKGDNDLLLKKPELRSYSGRKRHILMNH